jgi:hypothetical protein
MKAAKSSIGIRSQLKSCDRPASNDVKVATATG